MQVQPGDVPVPLNPLTFDESFQLVQFLGEGAHAEAQLFWIRNAVFITTVPVALALVALRESKVHRHGALIWLSIAGIVMCVLWCFLTYVGIVRVQSFFYDLKRLVKTEPALSNRLLYTFGDSSQISTGYVTGDISVSTIMFSPGSWMYAVAGFCGIGWIVVLTNSVWALTHEWRRYILSVARRIMRRYFRSHNDVPAATSTATAAPTPTTPLSSIDDGREVPNPSGQDRAETSSAVTPPSNRAGLE